MKFVKIPINKTGKDLVKKAKGVESFVKNLKNKEVISPKGDAHKITAKPTNNKAKLRDATRKFTGGIISYL